MTLQEQLDKAILFAIALHMDQLDKNGENYILHPLAVMMAVDTIEQKIVAVLHDILEDTAMTADRLREFRFSEEIVEAICILTREKDMPYMQYIEKVKSNELSRVVKLADLQHNMRDGCPASLLDRYKKAYKILRATCLW